MPALIEVNVLRKRFGDIEALAGVSFHVAAGDLRPARPERRRQIHDHQYSLRPDQA